MPRIPEHQNWIGGAWRGAGSEITFEVRDAAGDAPLGRFPRSSVEDLDLAVQAGLRARDAWRAMTQDERTRRVAVLQRMIEAEPGRHEWIEHRFGLTAPEYERCENALRAIQSDEHGLYTTPRSASPEEPGVVFHAPDWSELLERPLARLCAALADGCPVVLRADRQLAGAWEWVARAIERADLPSGSVALLHEDTQACLSAALSHPRISRAAISGPSARLKWAAQVAPADASSTRVPLDAVLLCNRTHRVDAEADIEREARVVSDGAFGRAPALSGQAPGQIGRVLCPERAFSRFTAALLRILDSDPGVANPIPIIDAETKLHLSRAHQLGIDEGATLILAGRGGAQSPVDALDGEQEARGTASRTARADGILRSVVFTNVEEHMRVAWLGRPAPVLCLMRVESDEHARSLAREFDDDSGAEDLSA